MPASPAATPPADAPTEPRQRQPRGIARTARVARVSRLTPEMVRIVFTGPDLAGLPVGHHTDAYVKLVFPPTDAPYRGAEEFAAMRDGLAAEHRPALRTYTIRAYDARVGELTLDFVVHGDQGIAGPWAAAAQPGDEVMMLGPGGGYAPDPAADWHLFVGDESALPAIAASLERLPPGVSARAFIEVAGPQEEQGLSSPADLQVTWVHRYPREAGAGGDARGRALTAAVRHADLPGGDVQVFLHGEAGFVKELRHHLRFERGIPKERLSVSGYWRLGRDDEGWRADKAGWKSEVDADERLNAG